MLSIIKGGLETMKTSAGIVGEFRVFTCTQCGSTFEKFFCHFERPEKFPVSECVVCRHSALLEGLSTLHQETGSRVA
jgi:hypothetical protein